ncbi:putative DNA helicase [Vibrio phage 207E48.1]|nr:putative DNA helicase [Vibrio phage 207E48.1]
MAYELYVEQLNARSMRVYCDEECVHMELSDFFKYEDPNFQPNRYSKWDGFVRLYDKKTGKMDVGLLEYLVKFCAANKYPLEVDPRLKNFRRVVMDEVHEYCDSLKLSRWDDGVAVPCTPYDYQYHGVERALKLRRTVLLADTGAGKSLMQYILTRFYIDEYESDNNRNAKILLLVPSVMLVNQMQSDFDEYSQFNGWSVQDNVHGITGGCSKLTRKRVVVSTWQSIQDEDADYFDQFTHLITDEVHGAAAAKISYICNNCINCYDRAGLTGTLHEEEMHKLQVQAHFGPIINVADTKLLQKLGQASKTLVTMMNMDYSESDRQYAKNLDYPGEIEFITNHPYRNKIIETMGLTLKGNTLMLFDRIDHINEIYERLSAKKEHVYVINGDVKTDVRDQIKAIVEASEGGGYTILASYGTMSTGVSMKNLHNLVFCHPSKSIVRVLQSLGRLLRRHKSKDIAMIYDLVDNLRVKGGDANHAIRHGMKRHGFYTLKGHKLRMKRYNIAKSMPDDTRQEITKGNNKRKAAKAWRDSQK